MTPAGPRRYAAVRRGLASETDDIDMYISGETRFLLHILRDAGLTDDELGHRGRERSRSAL